MAPLTSLLVPTGPRTRGPLAVAQVPLGSASGANSQAHVDEQPSLAVVLPSSQISAPALMLSPQVVVQTLGIVPTQVKPVCTVQVEEQPSLLTVLPSSHCSAP